MSELKSFRIAGAAGAALLLIAVSMGGTAMADVPRIEAVVDVDWSAWDADGGTAHGVVAQLFSDPEGRHLAPADISGDGVNEIIVSATGCDPAATCAFTILSHNERTGAWSGAMETPPGALELVQVAFGGETRSAIMIDDIPWRITDNGEVVPLLPRVWDLGEARDPYVDELDALYDTHDLSLPRSDLWASVTDLDLTGDGRDESLVQTVSTAFCALGGALCPFVVLDGNGTVLAADLSIEAPFVMLRNGDVAGLLAFQPAGFKPVAIGE